MQAIQVRRFGGPEVLEAVELDDPVPAAGQVLIAVELAGTTFVETQLRAGRPPAAGMLPELPMVPGNGVGGTVRALGPDAEPALLGRRVVSSLTGRGGYAQYAVADAATVVPVPETIGLDEATALLADGRTARALLEAARAALDLSGRTVLVAPAGGGVGTLLVSLLTREGARVVAAAGSEGKLAEARSRGAALAVTYTDPGWATTPGGVDLVLDGVGGTVGDDAVAALVTGGVVCRFGAASGRIGGDPAELGRPDARQIGLGRPSPADQRRLVTEALADDVRPTIGRRFALADAAEAHRAMENRTTTGKTLLETT